MRSVLVVGSDGWEEPYHPGGKDKQADITPQLSNLELGWIVGIIEGEGCFKTSSNAFTIEVSQKDTWILWKLQALLGGTVAISRKEPILWRWRISGGRARGLIPLLLPYLSPRRHEQAIRGNTWQT